MADWQKEWPTEPGSWWFYGYRFGNKVFPWKENEKRELCLVEVRKVSNGIILVTHGHFLDKREADGVWQKAILPELPVDSLSLNEQA